VTYEEQPEKSKTLEKSSGYYSAPLRGKMSIRNIDDQTRVHLKKDGPWIMGRHSSNTIIIPNDETISRTHCKIQLINNVPYLKDLGSTYGTFLNNNRITVAPLRPDDIIGIGKTRIIFEVKEAESIFQEEEQEFQISTIHQEDKCIIS